ncbi:MAG: hypothetical protein AABZ60_02265, partial [Planctomycetota bacterium]
SFAARGTTTLGKKVNLNVKFDAAELISRTCTTITWRNEARGTYWINGVGTQTINYGYMDITYNLLTGEIDSIGVGSPAPFEFEDMIDRNYSP